MNTYLEWLEFAETRKAATLVPATTDSLESHEREKAYWKGYLDAARDASRYVTHNNKGE